MRVEAQPDQNARLRRPKRDRHQAPEKGHRGSGDPPSKSDPLNEEAGIRAEIGRLEDPAKSRAMILQKQRYTVLG